jgi:hypothetical protein
MMDADVRQFLGSYETQIQTHAAKAQPGSPALAAVEALMHELRAMANTGMNIMDFMQKVNDGQYMHKLAAAMTELAMQSMQHAKQTGTFRVPTVAEVAAGYHRSFEAIENKESMPETCRVYQQIFAVEKSSATAPEFLRKMAEQNLFVAMARAPLIEKSTPQIANAEAISQPVMAFHHECMIEMARNAASAIEIETESRRLVELNRMELFLDQLLVLDLCVRIGNAVSSYDMSPTEENRQLVENTYRFLMEFYGIDLEELFGLERFRDYAEKVILRNMKKIRFGEGSRFIYGLASQNRCEVHGKASGGCEGQATGGADLGPARGSEGFPAGDPSS